ncbi:MAG TPA: hypothetical protein VHT51_10855 [Micropepsaceae bacterium]|jgi:hypothetical protein|nr:hypothetical protein [Micropepsaceae bacterium]
MPHFVFYDLSPEAKEKVSRLRWQLAGNRMLLAYYRLEALLAKANFNANEARVPAGDFEGGQWTRVAGASSTRRVPNQLPLPPIPVAANPNLSGRARATGATENSDKGVTIYRADGSVEARQGVSRSWRNNNPHNIVTGPFANRHGAIGSASGMAVFPDEITGGAAAAALLRTQTYSQLTIDQAIARRSPPSENDTGAVQRNVRTIGGFTGKEIIGHLGQDQFNRLIRAIRDAEGWRTGTVMRTPGRKPS